MYTGRTIARTFAFFRLGVFQFVSVRCKKYLYTYGYLVASFPHFIATGSFHVRFYP